MDRHALAVRPGCEAPGLVQHIDQIAIGRQFVMGRSDDGPVQLYPASPQRHEDNVALLQDNVSGHVTFEQLRVDVEEDFVPATSLDLDLA